MSHADNAPTPQPADESAAEPAGQSATAPADGRAGGEARADAVRATDTTGPSTGTTGPATGTAVRDPRRRPLRPRWRTVDIVVASVLGVAFGLLFAAWNNFIYPAISLPSDTTPFSPILGSIWLMPAVIGGLVIRRAGAALYTEVVAATTSMLFGSVWGLSVFMSGLWQGLGAELVFAAFAYRRWGIPGALLAGAGAGLAMGVNQSIVSVPWYDTGWKIAYILSAVAAGVAAGVLSWLLVRALARTGVLAPFPSGRVQREI
ncbi:ECF transporter S component [Phytoactinopolyspora halotolerans]|uniref:ECF transporter S component n=1 Tax=Phytoactinopolyspora halotolerans TaxID=1981512 RepID=A0A6L9SIF3_9ACTN|nr:ECF transporter S component [Phytoactinopolyspora halotolerans]NEE04111.1 ECF transporter S component [Phytoactinopolyspora halotolerans]